jgi:hypothetical protein
VVEVKAADRAEDCEREPQGRPGRDGGDDVSPGRGTKGSASRLEVGGRALGAENPICRLFATGAEKKP